MSVVLQDKEKSETKLAKYIQAKALDKSTAKTSSVRIVYDTLIEMLEIYVVSVGNDDVMRMKNAIENLGTTIKDNGDYYLNVGEYLLRRDDNDGELSFVESVIRGTREAFAFCEELKVINIVNTTRVGDT